MAKPAGPIAIARACRVCGGVHEPNECAGPQPRLGKWTRGRLGYKRFRPTSR